MESQGRSSQRCDGPKGIRGHGRFHRRRASKPASSNIEKERFGATLISGCFGVELEPYIVEQFGSEYLASRKARTELLAIDKEIAELKTRLSALEARKATLERAIKPKG